MSTWSRPNLHRRRRPRPAPLSSFLATFLSSAVVVLAASIGLVACRDDRAPTTSGTGSTPSNAGLEGALHVFAAASLTEAFTELGALYEFEHPGVDLTFNFAASSALAGQIIDGAAADVFVSADEPTMARVVDAREAREPRLIARNRLAIIVEPGNPKGIGNLADLADDGVLVVLCAPEVPCGRYGAAALKKAGVSVEAASLEENVKAVVSKVTLGEADAGIVYATDVRAAGSEADGVDIDDEIAGDPDLLAAYSIAITEAATHVELARLWVDFLLSDDGQAVLARQGFLIP